MRTMAMFMLLAGLSLGIAPQLVSAEKKEAPTTAPSCCGEKCKKMEGCCTVDDKGKETCSMGGKCCVKTEKK